VWPPAGGKGGAGFWARRGAPGGRGAPGAGALASPGAALGAALGGALALGTLGAAAGGFPALPGPARLEGRLARRRILAPSGTLAALAGGLALAFALECWGSPRFLARISRLLAAGRLADAATLSPLVFPGPARELLGSAAAGGAGGANLLARLAAALGTRSAAHLAASLASLRLLQAAPLALGPWGSTAAAAAGALAAASPALAAAAPLGFAGAEGGALGPQGALLGLAGGLLVHLLASALWALMTRRAATARAAGRLLRRSLAQAALAALLAQPFPGSPRSGGALLAALAAGGLAALPLAALGAAACAARASAAEAAGDRARRKLLNDAARELEPWARRAAPPALRLLGAAQLRLRGRRP